MISPNCIVLPIWIGLRTNLNSRRSLWGIIINCGGKKGLVSSFQDTIHDTIPPSIFSTTSPMFSFLSFKIGFQNIKIQWGVHLIRFFSKRLFPWRFFACYYSHMTKLEKSNLNIAVIQTEFFCQTFSYQLTFREQYSRISLRRGEKINVNIG